MFICSSILKALVLTLLILKILGHECTHDTMQYDIKISGSDYSLYKKYQGRFLQEYQNITILIDSSTLSEVTDDFRKYILEDLIPTAKSYLENTLKVPLRSDKLKAGGYDILCNNDIKVPSKYNEEGVDADLIIFVKAKYEPNANYVAAASACMLDTSTKRPTIGKFTYNLAKVAPTDNDAQREKDLLTTLHELTHALGFSSGLYRYYIDPETGYNLMDHLSIKTVMGYSTTILNLEPLTKRLRKYFDCSTLEGAFLENQGASGSVGSHFERRIFYNEYMTASAIIDTRITEFTLALLEGTGWYKVNYEMAEPITWGKNKGCSFIEGPCVNKVTSKPLFDEFCPFLLKKGCSWTKRAGSSCGAFKISVQPSLPYQADWWNNKTVSQDTFSDNCPIQLQYDNLDCEDPENQRGATISSEYYGYGSQCFMGTLFSRGELSSPYPYCFKSKCKISTEGEYYVEVKIGSHVVNCYSEQEVKVPGFSGGLNCPDPDQFCEQLTSEGFCRRKCSGRGSCVNKQCVCNEGWSGFDCSKSSYSDQCPRCLNGNPDKTSCFGDQCVCNPTNSSCMCSLGLKTSSDCSLLASYSSQTNKTENLEDINSFDGEPVPATTSGHGNPKEVQKNEKENGKSRYPDNMIDRNNSSGGLAIPIAGGIIGGIFGILVVCLAIKYAKKCVKAFYPSQIKEKQPPKLHVSKNRRREVAPINDAMDYSGNISPELMKSRLNTFGDSPLIKTDSPTKNKKRGKRNNSPDVAQTYGVQNITPIPEVHEFSLKLHPVCCENKLSDFEDPKFAAASTAVSLNLQNPA